MFGFVFLSDDFLFLTIFTTTLFLFLGSMSLILLIFLFFGKRFASERANCDKIAEERGDKSSLNSKFLVFISSSTRSSSSMSSVLKLTLAPKIVVEEIFSSSVSPTSYFFILNRFFFSYSKGSKIDTPSLLNVVMAARFEITSSLVRSLS